MSTIEQRLARPYYDEDGITIYNCNCADVVPFLDRVDLLLTDPPYGLDIDYIGYDDSVSNLEALIPTISEYIAKAERSVIFPGIHNVWRYPKADWIACWFYGTTGSWGKIGYNSWQPMLFYGKNNNRYGLDTIKYSKMEKRYPGHPCSKPVGLMEAVITRFHKEGAIIDPFMGSGTTLVAAKKLGKRAIGVEREEKYCRIAARRLEQQLLP
jgi:site-specific DNA-methyltransferase (adenine-specific)